MSTQLIAFGSPILILAIFLVILWQRIGTLGKVVFVVVVYVISILTGILSYAVGIVGEDSSAVIGGVIAPLVYCLIFVGILNSRSTISNPVSGEQESIRAETDQATLNFPLEWDLLAKWIAATSLGFLIFDGASMFISQQSFVYPLYILFFQGLIVAILQWLLVLQLRIPGSRQWILWGTIGWAVGWLMGKFSTVTIISLLIHGVTMGLIQWAFLVRKLYSKSLMWVLINTIGLPLAYGLSWFVIFPLILGNYDGLFSGPLDSAIRGALFGAITGTTLIWLSRLPHAEIDLMNSQEL